MQARNITVEYGVEKKPVQNWALGPFSIGRLIESETFAISAMLMDVTATNLRLAFGGASEAAGVISLGQSTETHVAVSLTVAANVNGALTSAVFAIAYATVVGAGSVDLEDPPHAFPIRFEADKKDVATAPATITVT